MERRASGIGSDLRHTIAFALDSRDERLVRHLLGTRHADRRHFAVAQLAQDLLPSLAVVAEIGEVQGLQIEFCLCLGTKMAGVAIDFRGLPKCLLIKYRAMARLRPPTWIFPPTKMLRARGLRPSITCRLQQVLGFESCVAPLPRAEESKATPRLCFYKVLVAVLVVRLRFCCSFVPGRVNSWTD